MAAADSYDAMTSDRIYRKGMPADQAMAELKGCSGTQFDPRIVEAFLVYLTRNEIIAPSQPERPRPLALETSNTP